MAETELLQSETPLLRQLIGRYHLPIDILTLDAELLFPETYGLWRRLEDRYEFMIRAVQPALTVEKKTITCGQSLWSRKPDKCCETRTASSLALELSEFDAWVTAIGHDQTAARSEAPTVGWEPKLGLVKVNRLVRWFNKDVWAYLHRNKVPYNSLRDRGYPSIKCHPCNSFGGRKRPGRPLARCGH